MPRRRSALLTLRRRLMWGRGRRPNPWLQVPYPGYRASSPHRHLRRRRLLSRQSPALVHEDLRGVAHSLHCASRPQSGLASCRRARQRGACRVARRQPSGRSGVSHPSRRPDSFERSRIPKRGCEPDPGRIGKSLPRLPLALPRWRRTAVGRRKGRVQPMADPPADPLSEAPASSKCCEAVGGDRHRRRSIPGEVGRKLQKALCHCVVGAQRFRFGDCQPAVPPTLAFRRYSERPLNPSGRDALATALPWCALLRLLGTEARR